MQWLVVEQATALAAQEALLSKVRLTRRLIQQAGSQTWLLLMCDWGRCGPAGLQHMQRLVVERASALAAQEELLSKVCAIGSCGCLQDNVKLGFLLFDQGACTVV